MHLFDKIAARLLLLALCLASVPIGVLVGVTLDRAEKAIHEEALRKLMLVASDRHNRVESYLRQARAAVENEGLEPLLGQILDPANPSAAQGGCVSKDRVCEELQRLAGPGAAVSVVDNKGLVVLSTDPGREGSDCSHEEHFLKGRKTTYVSDIFYDTVDKRMTWITAAPITRTSDQSLLGVVVNRIDPRQLDAVASGGPIEHDKTGGEPRPGFRSRVCLVNRDGRQLTGVLPLSDSLRGRLVDTKPVHYARDNRKGMCGDYTDMRWIKVTGASEVIPELGWLLLAETDYDEAMAPYTRFRNVILVLALAILAFTLVLVLRLGTIIVRPLRALVRAEERLAAEGDVAALVPDEHILDDEVGQLIRRRNLVISRVLAAEKRHRDLVDEIDGIAWEAEVGTWRFTFVNRRAEQILGYPAEQWLSEPGFWVRHLHPLDRSRTVQAYLEASISGKDLRLEYRMIASDGHPVWLRDQAHLVAESFGTAGPPVRQLRGLMIDITAAKQAQDLLQESERRARTIIDLSQNAMIGIDYKGDVSVFNRAAEQMFQVAAREIMGQSMTHLVPEDLRGRHAKAIAHYLETGRSAGAIGQTRELEGLRSDGSVFPMEIALTPTNDKTIRVIAVIQDITRRKKADDDLHQHYRQINGLHQLADALIHAETTDEIYAQAMSCAKLALKADRASILLSDPDGPMRFKASDGLSERYRAEIEGRMPWREDDPNPRPLLFADASAVVEQGTTQATILTRKELEELRPIILHEGIGALGAIPLVYQGRLLGRLMMYFNSPHAFTDAEVQLAQTIAAHVAFAIGRQRAESVLRAIVDGTSLSIGMGFFRALVRHLATTLHVRWAFVGESIGAGRDKIRSIALWSGGDYAPNFEYDLAGTPCEGVIGRAMCCYPKGVAQLFPHDLLLADLRVESYVGVRLSDSVGRSLGILVVMHDAPIREASQIEAVLSVFAARAGAELERMKTERHSEREQPWHHSMPDQTGETFFICDASTGRLIEASPAFQSFLGYTREELLLLTLPELGDNDSASLEHLLKDDGGVTHHTLPHMRFRRKDGVPAEAKGSASPIISDYQRALFVLLQPQSQAASPVPGTPTQRESMPVGVP